MNEKGSHWLMAVFLKHIILTKENSEFKMEWNEVKAKPKRAAKPR